MGDNMKAMIDLDHLSSDNPSKKQAIRERDIALARCSALMTCLDGLVGNYEAAREQLPTEAFDLFRAFLDSEIRGAKLALTALISIDLRARANALAVAGWEQPSPTGGDARPVWEAIVADLMPNATTPAAAKLLEDMQSRDALGRERYGTPLTAHNGRDALLDLYAAELDAVAYAWQCIAEDPGDYTLRSVYHAHVQIALATRRRILIRDMTKSVEADPTRLLRAVLTERKPTPFQDDNPDDDADAPTGYRCASGCGVVDSVDGLCPICGDVATGPE